MNKRHLSIFACAVLCAALIALSGCRRTGSDGGPPPPPPPKKSILAMVYTDLTKSIDDDTANRQKRNIATLFQKLPYDAKFYLYSIDRGTNKPSIYEYLPTFTQIIDARTQDKLAQEIEETKTAKESTELEKLNSALNTYHASITQQEGPVSCISNKLNALVDMADNNRGNATDYDVRIFFYSDMIEQCHNSFDAKPLDLERKANDNEEQKHIADIQNRIKNFDPVSSTMNLKSLDAKVYIVLTSQDDKQSLKTLKDLWGKFFGKLGLSPEQIVWANGNGERFWTLVPPAQTAQK